MMYRATRELIAERLKTSKFKNISVVSVKYMPIGIPNQCHQNTFEYRSKDVLGTGCQRGMPVSGWLVGEYNKQKQETEIIQHWWFMDSVTEQHVDTTPIGTEEGHKQYEYVVDLELSIWGNDNYDKIDSNVGSSLLRKDNKWFLVKGIDGDTGKLDTRLSYEETESLEVSVLFKDNLYT